jgi:hypothetical protein
MNGQINNNMWGGIAGALGNLAGTFGSSYGKGGGIMASLGRGTGY